MKSLFCGLFIVLLFSCPLFSQKKQMYIIDKNSENCYLFNNHFAFNSDTTHFYVCFESDFNQDSIVVFANDSIVYSGIISTNHSAELATIIKIGLKDDVNYFGFQVNSETPVLFKSISEKSYLRVNYYETSTGEKCINICFSKFKPFYY